MKLTSLCGHALYGLVSLARHAGGGPVSAEMVAEAEGLSATFLAKALKALTSAGLLRSLKGPRGGYRLARPARSITLLEVVEAVDGPVRGEAPRVGAADGHRLDARLQAVCDQAAEAVRQRLREVSLADLAVPGGRRAKR
jgi:Rrf2 family protein